MNTVETLTPEEQLKRLPAGTIAKAIQILDNDLFGRPRAVLLERMKLPDWELLPASVTTGIWVRNRLIAHNLTSGRLPAGVRWEDTWHFMVEMALGVRPAPERVKRR